MLNQTRTKQYAYIQYMKKATLFARMAFIYLTYVSKIIRYAGNRCVRYALKQGDAECQQA